MCASGSGCPVQEASGAVECVCAGAVPAPPPPIPGSDEWLQSDEHALVAPGPEAASAGLDMAMYEAGHAAVHLADYLKHKADTEEVRSARLPCVAPAACWGGAGPRHGSKLRHGCGRLQVGN